MFFLGSYPLVLQEEQACFCTKETEPSCFLSEDASLKTISKQVMQNSFPLYLQ